MAYNVVMDFINKKYGCSLVEPISRKVETYKCIKKLKSEVEVKPSFLEWYE